MTAGKFPAAGCLGSLTQIAGEDIVSYFVDDFQEVISIFRGDPAEIGKQGGSGLASGCMTA